MDFFLRFQIFLQLFFVITIAGDTTTPASLITDESCANNKGKWTVWTYIYNSNRTSSDNAEETYMNFYDVAENTCFPPIIFQIVQNLQEKSADSSLEDSFYESVLAYYASLLSNADFRFRYCCSTDNEGESGEDYDYYDDGTTESIDVNTAMPMEWLDANTDMPTEPIDATTDTPYEWMDINTAMPMEWVDSYTDMPTESMDVSTDTPYEWVDANTNQPTESMGGSTDMPVEFFDVHPDTPTEKTTTSGLDYNKTDDYGIEANSTSAPLLTAVDGAVCGKQAIAPSSGLSSKIFGGSEAIPHSWPWMIRYSQKTTQCEGAPPPCYTACGGTLISNNFIITAAHCISTTDPSNIRLIAGMHQQSSQSEWDTRQTRTVSSIHVHPQFNPNRLSNDIALLRVDPPFNYTTYVQPACLSNEDPQADERVIIVGWGAEFLGSSMVDDLKQANTTVVGNCWEYWGGWVTDKQICVANTQNGDSACKGDSGGPIMTMVNGQYVASGVASFTRSCITTGYDGFPNVYTRISSYRTWIDKILNQKK